MDWNIKSRNTKLTDRQREYIQEKLSKLGRYLDGIQDMKVEVRHETLRSIGEAYTTQVTLLAEHGVILRAEDRDKELRVAIDTVSDNLQRQIRRYKEKHYRRGRLRRSGGEIVSAPLLELEGDEPTETVEERQIVRSKDVALRPMFSDEAIEQMELLGHSFFVFRDAETERINVVYRRHDGNYGLIIPR